MIIDLRTILHGPRRFDFTLQRDWWSGDEERHQIMGMEEPLNVHMNIYRAGSRYVVEGELSGRLRIMCDRCLEPFPYNLASDFRLFLALPSSDMNQIDMELSEEDLAVDFIDGEELDLDEIVRAQIYLSLPMKSLCSKDCQGLCPVCGINHNVEKCNCRNEKAHPGLSKLKNLKLK